MHSCFAIKLEMMRCATITTLFIVLAVVKTTISHIVCVSISGSDHVGCSNGNGCCASLSVLVKELSNCSTTAVPAAASKLVIHVKSDLQLNETLYIRNFCNDFKGVEVVGSNPHQTISCNTHDAGLYFKGIQNLTIAHVNFSRCGSQQEHISQNRSNSTLTFYSTLYLVYCRHVVINNVGVHNSHGTGVVL